MKEYIPLRVKIKQLLRHLLPSGIFSSIQKIWIATFARFFKVQDVLNKYTAQFLAKYPKTVQAGPFAGLHYVNQAIGSNYLHKLVGSYESILHPYVNALAQKQFDTIIDIGAAEGYYLVGLGKQFPGAKLVGFELEETGRTLIQEMYDLNRLKNELVLEGEATAQNIGEHITNNTLLICDCEGAELDILNPVQQVALKKVETAIIELHDFIRPGIKEFLTERFSPTHTITLVPFKMADYTQFPFLAAITNEADRYEVLRERGWQEQEWMILERK